MTSGSSNEDDLSFDSKFNSFIQTKINRTDSELSVRMSDHFWTEISTIVLSKLKQADQDELQFAQMNSSILNNFCSLFHAYENTSKQSRVGVLIETLFNFILNNFMLNLDKLNQSNDKNEQTRLNKITFIYLECLNTIVRNFMSEDLLLWFSKSRSTIESESLDERLKKVNDEILNAFFHKCQSIHVDHDADLEHNLLFGLIELYLLVNSNVKLSNKDQLITRIDQFLSQTYESGKFAHIESLFKTFLLKSKSKKIDSDIRQHFVNFIIQSDNLTNILLDHLLKDSNLFSDASLVSSKLKNHELAFDILEVIVKHESVDIRKEKAIDLLFDRFMRNSIRFLESLNASSDNFESVDLNQLNNYLKFNTSLVFRLDKVYLLKFVDLSKLWSILLNNLVLKERLKLKLSKSSKDKIELNLNELMNSIASIMVNEYLLKRVDDLNAFKELKEFIGAYLDKQDSILSNLIVALVSHFEHALNKLPKSEANHWLNDFYTLVLFDLSFLFDYDQVKIY